MQDTSPLPELRTTRLCLRLPHPDGAGCVASFFGRNLDHLRPFQPTLPADFTSEPFWRRELSGAWAAHRKGEAARWFVFDAGEPQGTPIGYVSLTSIKRGNCQSAELSYAIDRARGGAGLMREAVREVLDYAREVLELHRIDAKYRADNAKSGALLDDFGFVMIGIAPRYAEIDGAWRDHALRSLVLEGADAGADDEHAA